MPEVQGNNLPVVLGGMAVGFVVVVFAIVTILGLAREGEVTGLNGKVSQLNKDLSAPEMKQTLEQYEALDTVITHMDRVRKQRFIFEPVWGAVKAAVPSDVSFTSVAMDDDASFRVTGKTRSVNSVAAFAKALDAHSSIEKVTPLSVDKASESNLYNFTITFEYKSLETVETENGANE